MLNSDNWERDNDHYKFSCNCQPKKPTRLPGRGDDRRIGFSFFIPCNLFFIIFNFVLFYLIFNLIKFLRLIEF